MTEKQFIASNPFLLADEDSTIVTTRESTIIQGRFFKQHSFIFSILDSDERKIIKLRYGVYTETPLAFSQIAQKLNISVRQAMQIHDRAFKRLRNPRILEMLKNYTNDTITEKALNRYTRRKGHDSVIEESKYRDTLEEMEEREDSFVI